MKRKIFITLFAVFFFITYRYFNSHITKPPERLSNIPQKAKWCGGADGGNWYEVTKVLPNNIFMIKIYNEGSGEIEVDTIFTLNSDCTFKHIDSITLIKSINGYDGDKILLNMPDKGERCSLIMN
jgi:hypothetical protein